MFLLGYLFDSIYTNKYNYELHKCDKNFVMIGTNKKTANF